MLHSRFFLKLFAGYVVIILFCTAIVGLMIARQMEQDSLAEIDDRLQNQARALRQSLYPILGSARTGTLQQHITQLARYVDARVTLIAEDGTVLADSEQDPAAMDNHRDRPELQETDKHGLGLATRYSGTLSKMMRYLALPVDDADHRLGYIRVALPTSRIDRRLAHLRNVVIVAATLTAIIALLLGYFMARGFAQPLQRMTTMARALTAGDFQPRLEIDRRDEMGELAGALNRLAQTAAQRMETITADRNKLAAILTGMVEGVIAVDRFQRIIHINDAASRVVGAVAEECLGKTLLEVTHIDAITDAINQSLGHHGVVQSKLRMSAPPRYFDLYATVLSEGGSQPTGAVLVLHDVTELHHLETVRRDFVANASHELKTPVTAIHGLAETLLADDKMDVNTCRRFLQKIYDQSLQLSQLVADLLALSRLEADDTITFSTINVVAIVTETCNALQAVAREKMLTLETQISADSAAVVGDPKSLGQLFTNLVDNAIKYTPAGGNINLRLKVIEGSVIIEIADDGIGIDAAEQQRIFERFYRVDKGRSRRLGGTGLGLAIVKHIAKRHQGDVTVVSTLGKGSVFRVVLPVANS